MTTTRAIDMSMSQAFMQDAVKAVKPLYKSVVDASGGCDHSVGLCWCQDYTALEKCDQALAKAGIS